MIAAAALFALPFSGCSKKDTKDQAGTKTGGAGDTVKPGGAKEAGGDSTGTGSGGAKPVEGCNSDLSQPITADTTFTAKCSPYKVAGDLAVDGWNLTVEPGVEIQFADGANLGVAYTKASKLFVKGTAEKPVKLVGVRKEAGSWHGVRLWPQAEGSTLENLTIEYAGSDQAALFIEAADVSVKGLAVVKTRKTALNVLPQEGAVKELSGLDFSQAGGDPDELVTLQTMSVGALGAGNKFPEKAVIVAGGAVYKDVKVTVQPAPYRFLGEITVDAPEGKSASLSFEAGVVAQMSETAVIAIGYNRTGHLKIAGTAEKPVTFTRYGEDPKATPWKGIVFWGHARAPQIDYAVFEYVGSKEEAAMKFEGDALGLGSITHTTFKHVPGDAIVVTSPKERFTAFDNNTFEDVGGASLSGSLYWAHNLGAANKLTYVRITEGTSEDVTLKAVGAPYQLEGEIAFNGAGAKISALTIEPGAALRFSESGSLGIGYNAAARLVAKGTADKPITFANATEGQKWQGLAAWGNGTLELENCTFTSVNEEKPAIDVQPEGKGSVKSVTFKDVKVGVKNCGKVATAGLKIDGAGKAVEKCE
jgi:hypothetical protein